jgi:transposase
MKIEGIDLESTVANIKEQLDSEPDLSPALKGSIELLLILMTGLFNRLGLNSSNSSKPPSADPNRDKKDKKNKDGSPKKPGGQKGRKGVTLQKFEEPDVVKDIPLNRANLPKGSYTHIGWETRQVVDIDISRLVTEFRAEILVDNNGKRYIASFPDKVTKAIQYGNSVKAQVVYLRRSTLFDGQSVRINDGESHDFKKWSCPFAR